MLCSLPQTHTPTPTRVCPVRFGPGLERPSFSGGCFWFGVRLTKEPSPRSLPNQLSGQVTLAVMREGRQQQSAPTQSAGSGRPPRRSQGHGMSHGCQCARCSWSWAVSARACSSVAEQPLIPRLNPQCRKKNSLLKGGRAPHGDS